MKDFFHRRRHLYVPIKTDDGGGETQPPDDGGTYIVTDADLDVITNDSSWIEADPSG